MSQQEISVRVTRAAKRRAEAISISTDQPSKKRIVLGDITNVQPNLVTVSRPGKLRIRSNKKEPEPIESNPEDPQMCGPYASEIYDYLRSMEIQKKRRPLANYLETIQRDVTANMRGTLVDWLVEVGEEYKVVPTTLYLAVSYLDRFLSKIAINRQRLQLLGVTCMLIASKYEEISPRDVEDFCFITDYTYTKEEVVKMEADILKFLNFEMGNPTIKVFLDQFTRAAQENCKIPSLQLEFLGCYLAELSLLDYACIRFLPSMVAASVIFLVRFTMEPKMHPWNLALQQCAGYRASDLKECVFAIHDLQISRRGGSLFAVREKYKQPKFKCVATLISPQEIPLWYFEDVER